MSDQDGRQAPALPRPSPEDAEAWKAYWEAQGQPWRTEPEVDEERQKHLTERRAILPDIKEGNYPFKDIKLSRADVEWLLATHENGRGPVNWSDESQRGRKGLDLRGADLCQADLSHLPLARLRGGLTLREWRKANEEQRSAAVVLLKGANLNMAHLEGAYLRKAHLEHVNLFRAYLEWTHLDEAHLERASLIEAHLDKTYLAKVKLSDGKYGGPQIVDAYWGDGNLAVVQWSQIEIVGEEYQARQKMRDGKKKDRAARLEEYEVAVRANRQLASVLQNQGLNEEAARFAYRAQKLQRVVLRRQKKFGQYLFSGFLDLLAGYGYRPGRSVLWYLMMILVFALAYSTFGHLSLWPPDAFVYSLTAFHGRGFFPGLEGKHSLHDPLIMLAAFEAVVGLLIEISFIATFTQRFFGK